MGTPQDPRRPVLPKSYEANYSFFDSPVPMIYFFQSEKFELEKLKHTDLEDKCIFCIDTDTVLENTSDPGLDEFPQKMYQRLRKNLEKLVGVYNREYMDRKRSLTREEYDRGLDKEDDAIPFDYWKVRECFFEVVLELVQHYGKFYKDSKIVSGQLNSSEVYDFAKFTKSKSGTTKEKNFMNNFTKTSIFSRFIECRIAPENRSQEIYYNHFDFISQIKEKSPKQDVIQRYKSILDNYPPLQVLAPNLQGINYNEEFLSYGGILPQMDHDLFTQSRVISRPRPKIVLEESLSFLDENSVMKMNEEKWARCNIEILYTVWFITLKIFIKGQPLPSGIHLVTFAYDKFIEMENEKIRSNIEIVKSLAFLLGVYREVTKFQRIFRKSAEEMEENNLSIAVYAEYVKGIQIEIQPLELSLKKEIYSQQIRSIDLSIEHLEKKPVLEEDQEKRDDRIPVSLKSHFETNAFCVKCGTYIPEEIILARMTKDFFKTRAICPNQACGFEYEPAFNIMILKEKGCKKFPSPTKLHSPLRLFIETRYFLETHDCKDLFNVKQNKLRNKFLEICTGTSFFTRPSSTCPASTCSPKQALMFWISLFQTQSHSTLSKGKFRVNPARKPPSIRAATTK